MKLEIQQVADQLTSSPSSVPRLLRGVIYPDSNNTYTMVDKAPVFSGVYDRLEYKYNCQSELIETKDQNGTVHQFDYDPLGRQTADKVTTLGSGVDYAVRRIERDYEVRGMVEQVTRYSNVEGGGLYVVGDVQLAYNHLGQLTADRQEHSDYVDQDTPSVRYAYDPSASNGQFTKSSRPTTLTYPNGRLLRYEYSSGADDTLGRISFLADDNGGAVGTHLAEYTHLGLGQVVRVDNNKIGANDPTLRCNLAFGAGNDPYDGLDQFGRVKDLRWTNYAGTTDLVGIKHGYDRAGNRLWRRDVVSAAQATPVYLDELYAYDGMYQLTSLRRGQLNSTEDDLVADSKKFAEQWTLDPLGNWTNFKQDTDADSDWELDQNRTHNKANEVATIAGEGVEVAHDAAGNMVVAPKPED